MLCIWEMLVGHVLHSEEYQSIHFIQVRYKE
jgi:hypothetical protein